MKIIVVLYRYEPDGADTIRVMAYVKHFIEKGHNVTLVTTLRTSGTISIDGCQVVVFKSLNRGPLLLRRIVNGFLMVFWANRISRKGDVVYFYSVPMFGLLINRRANVFYEETEVPTPVGDETELRKIITAIRVKTINRAKGLIVISNSLKCFYRERGVPTDKIIVSNMFVDISRFKGVTKKMHDTKYIGYCGTVSNHKDGVHYLIQAFSKVHQRHPELHLKIAGVFTVKEEKAFDEQLVETENLQEYVHFLGMVPATEMPQFLVDAECLVLARPNNRQAQYGFPTKLGEYLSSGNPVVVTKVGDIPLYLTDGVNAFMAEPDNVDSISSKILEALGHPLSQAVGTAGVNTVRANFDSKVEAGKLLAFFEGCNQL